MKAQSTPSRTSIDSAVRTGTDVLSFSGATRDAAIPDAAGRLNTGSLPRASIGSCSTM